MYCKDNSELDLCDDDIDYMYDMMRDDFLLCSSVKEALELIKRYGYALSNKFLPEQYKYLLKEEK